jgi:hypothetical protein
MHRCLRAGLQFNASVFKRMPRGVSCGDGIGIMSSHGIVRGRVAHRLDCIGRFFINAHRGHGAAEYCYGYIGRVQLVLVALITRYGFANMGTYDGTWRLAGYGQR